MKNLKVFKINNFGEIRVLKTNNKVWFIANDIAEVLGYENPSDAVNKHCKHIRKEILQSQVISLIDEKDVYRLVQYSTTKTEQIKKSFINDLIVRGLLRYDVKTLISRVKVGDKVKIKSKEELKWLNSHDVDVVDIMYRYADRYATITKVIDKELWYDADIPEYKLDIDNDCWTWYEILFEKL